MDEKEEDAGEDAEEAKSKNEEEKEEQEEKDAEGNFWKELCPFSRLSTKINNKIDHWLLCTFLQRSRLGVLCTIYLQDSMSYNMN